MLTLYRPLSDPYLATARAYALQHSDDYRRPTGAVIVDSTGVIHALAANRSGLGRSLLARMHPRWCLRRRVETGRAYWLCPGCASPSGHAEARAASIIRDKDLSDKYLTCFLWGHTWACEPCTAALASVGVKTLALERRA